jgi:hypothetical protein
MKQSRVFLVCLAVGMAFGLVCRAQSPAPDERGLWLAWVASTNTPDDHAAVVTACKQFRTKAPQDPFCVVVTGMEAWHLLKMGSTNAAMALFEPMMSIPENASPLQSAGDEMARGWLTRLDREKVRLALKKLYLKQIEFPSSLDPIKTLKMKSLPPFTDRWGKAWTYRLESSIKGMSSQQYVLESSRLGSRSDLGKALALPYAGRVSLEPIKVSPVSADTVEFAIFGGKSGYLQAGGTLNGVTVAYIGMNIIVMADENHWRVVLKPR